MSRICAGAVKLIFEAKSLQDTPQAGQINQSDLNHLFNVIEIFLVAPMDLSQGDGVEVKVENVQQSIPVYEQPSFLEAGRQWDELFG